ncbi:MAG: helix-turn-helix domain-containing protein [Blautia sp.]|nr:helix-turn-helix domain-containing protein [Blautia sp.]
MNISDRIKRHRIQLGYSVEKLAEELELSTEVIEKWEKGEERPELDMIEKLGELFRIPPGRLLDDDLEPKWELKDRIFQEDNMYRFVERTAEGKELEQVKQVLPLVRKLHEGQYRKGKDRVPYIYHPLMISCHALALNLVEDDLIATALLHDVVEDCNVDINAFPIHDCVKEAVLLLTFRQKAGETKAEAKIRYYEEIGKNRLATIVKVLDRCNNISTMTSGFSPARIAFYIEETERFVMPLLTIMKFVYPECNNAAFLVKYQMRSVLESLKRLI